MANLTTINPGVDTGFSTKLNNNFSALNSEIADTTTGHDHDGVDSKQIGDMTILGNVCSFVSNELETEQDMRYIYNIHALDAKDLFDSGNSTNMKGDDFTRPNPPVQIKNTTTGSYTYITKNLTVPSTTIMYLKPVVTRLKDYDNFNSSISGTLWDTAGTVSETTEYIKAGKAVGYNYIQTKNVMSERFFVIPYKIESNSAEGSSRQGYARFILTDGTNEVTVIEENTDTDAYLSRSRQGVIHFYIDYNAEKMYYTNSYYLNTNTPSEINRIDTGSVSFSSLTTAPKFKFLGYTNAGYGGAVTVYGIYSSQGAYSTTMTIEYTVNGSDWFTLPDSGVVKTDETFTTIKLRISGVIASGETLLVDKVSIGFQK